MQRETAEQPQLHRTGTLVHSAHACPGHGRNDEFADYSRLRGFAQTRRLRPVCGTAVQSRHRQPKSRRPTMDPVFAVMLDVARLATHQPPAIKQTWGTPERFPEAEPMPQAAAKKARAPIGINWLLSLSLRPR